MTEFLPCVEWSEAYYASFHNILARVLKLFKKYQNDTNVSRVLSCSQATAELLGDSVCYLLALFLLHAESIAGL